jgi:hypothetical protein
MIEAVAASTQSAFDTMSSNLSERMTTTVKAEVSALDVKFRALLDSSSSVHSGSQALSLSSQQSARSTLDSGNRQVWRCPVCQFPLKHEKSLAAQHLKASQHESTKDDIEQCYVSDRWKQRIARGASNVSVKLLYLCYPHDT